MCTRYGRPRNKSCRRGVRGPVAHSIPVQHRCAVRDPFRNRRRGLNKLSVRGWTLFASPDYSVWSEAFRESRLQSGRAEFPDAGRNQTSLRETFFFRRPARAGGPSVASWREERAGQDQPLAEGPCSFGCTAAVVSLERQLAGLQETIFQGACYTGGVGGAGKTLPRDKRARPGHADLCFQGRATQQCCRLERAARWHEETALQQRSGQGSSRFGPCGETASKLMILRPLQPSASASEKFVSAWE